MNHKNYSLREMLIDKCLQSGRGRSVKEMMRFINDYAEQRGMARVNSRQTIHNDLLSIENKYCVRIARERSGNTVRYRYAEPGASIFNDELTVERYERMHKLLGEYGFTGVHFLEPLLDAIEQRRPVWLVYQGFSRRLPLGRRVHPYRLKMYHERWYLLGWNEHGGHLSVFGLDRIAGMKLLAAADFKPAPPEAADFFEGMVGVTRRPCDEPCEVVMRVNKSLLPYLRTRPIHHSQAIAHAETDRPEVRLHVIVNRELKQELLQYGSELAVERPASLRNALLEEHRKAMEIM